MTQYRIEGYTQAKGDMELVPATFYNWATMRIGRELPRLAGSTWEGGELVGFTQETV